MIIQPKRILFIDTVRIFDGGQNYIMDLLNNSRSKNFEVTLSYPENTLLYEYAEQQKKALDTFKENCHIEKTVDKVLELMNA